jgi:hypothetical protein
MLAWVEQHGQQPGECRWIALDGDEARESVMQVCSDEGHRAVYLIDDDAGRWVIEHEGWGHVPVCDPAALGEDMLLLRDTGPGDDEERRVALRDGRPAIIRSERASVREIPLKLHEVWDFDQARLHRELEADPEGCANPGKIAIDAAILVVGGAELSVDGQLRVRAVGGEGESVRVHVQIHDDAHEPADELVLRWASPNAAAIDPLGCESVAITELRITAGNPPNVAGSGALAAVVQGEFEALTIDLDAQALQLGAVPWQLPFMIEFGSLATSQFVAGRPGSLGALVRYPEDRRYPPIGVGVE